MRSVGRRMVGMGHQPVDQRGLVRSRKTESPDAELG